MRARRSRRAAVDEIGTIEKNFLRTKLMIAALTALGVSASFVPAAMAVERNAIITGTTVEEATKQ